MTDDLVRTDWTELFVRTFSKSGFGLEDIEVSMLEKATHAPKRLYKYHSVNDYSLSNLRSKTIWASKPSEYNDPYDCALKINWGYFSSVILKNHWNDFLSRTKLRDHLDEVKLEACRESDNPFDAILESLLDENDEDLGLPIEKVKAIFKDVGESVNREYLDGNLTKEFQGKLLISSFSERKDSVLMWSHYAKNHTGFCVEYSISENSWMSIPWRTVFPVLYRDELIDLSTHLVDEEGRANPFAAVIAAIHKASDWSYEREWRLVLPFGESDIDQNIAMPCPSRILLGSRISDADIAQIERIVTDLNIPVIPTELDKREFRIVELGTCSRLGPTQPQIQLSRDPEAARHDFNRPDETGPGVLSPSGRARRHAVR